MKWFTTLHSLNQHVWHIEHISMTTLTFDEGTENCFESMESTDPSWVLRCKVKIYYMALKSFFWNIGVYPKSSQGRHKNIWIREQIWLSLCITGVQQKKMRKNWYPRLRPVPTSCQVTQRLWTEVKCYLFIYLFIYNSTLPPSPITIFFDLYWKKHKHNLWIYFQPTFSKQVEATGLDESLKYILQVPFLIVLPGNQQG